MLSVMSAFPQKPPNGRNAITHTAPHANTLPKYRALFRV